MATHDQGENKNLRGSNFLLNSELPGKRIYMTICNLCGEDHYTESCSLLSELKHVKDTPTISRARLTLPSGLKVVNLADLSTTIVASERFNQGAHFGPFQAHLTTDLHPGVSFPLKITGKCSNDGYYLDTTDEEICNWMCLVAQASSASEQNLICYEMKQSIYFTAIKDILPGEELRVWYAFYYGLKLQALPLADESDSEENLVGHPNNKLESKPKIRTNAGLEMGRELLESLAQHLPAHTFGARIEKDRWQCRFCEKQENNVALYAKHLMTHYRPQCHLCSRRFYSDDALSKHQKNKHSHLESVSDVQHQPNGDGNAVVTSDIKSSSLNAKKHVNDNDEGVETPIISSESCNHQRTGESQSTQSNVEEIQNTVGLSNNNVVLENYGNFCPPISANEDCQDVITINNLNTSETVQTQLVLANDGSAVYHVANLPNGILAAEMDKFGLPILVVNNVNSSQIEETDPIVWGAQTENFTASSESDNREHSALLPVPQAESSGTELYSVANQVKEDDRKSVPLILLNTQENENQSDQPETQSNQPTNQTVELNPNELLGEPSEAFGEVSEKMKNSTRKTEPERLLIEEKDRSSIACDICSKTFEKSAYLYRHLRKHTGEFTCINCLAVFARKENLQSHSCTRPMVRHPCHICGKKFSARKYLQRHIPLHTGEFTCDKCKRPFVSKLSLACHRCRTDTGIDSDNSIKCLLCERSFANENKLQAHLTHHSETNPDGVRTFLASTLVTRKLCKRKKNSKLVPPEQQPDDTPKSSNGDDISKISQRVKSSPQNEDKSTGQNNSKGFICEICGSIFKSFSSMKTHRFLHGERRFECRICGKRFHRKDVLQEHISVHQSPQLPCAECGKKFKTKKSLEVHMMIHAGAKRFTCDDCGKDFYQKGNLIKHQRIHTPPEDRKFVCQYCSKSFTSREYLSMHTLEHTQGKIFQCPHCSKSFVKKHLLETHQQTTHSNKAFLCRYCNSFMRHRHSARRHLEQQHPDKITEWSKAGFVDQILAELPPDSLLLNNGVSFPGQQEIRQDQLLSLRRQHFGTNVTVSKDVCYAAGKGEISATNQSTGTTESCPPVENTQTFTHDNSEENPDPSTEEIATLTLQQHVELLTDPVMCHPHIQGDEVNIVSVSLEEKKQDEEILLNVVEHQLQGVVVREDISENALTVSTCTPETLTSKGESAQVMIGGNTYILQDQVIFEEDEIASGDILLYVLDSEAQ